MKENIRLEVPQFGGSNMVIAANDTSVAIDGSHHVSLRLPICSCFGTFSNVDGDAIDKQLVVEVSQATTKSLVVRLALTERKKLGNNENILITPPVTEAALLTIDLVEGELTIMAQRPIKSGRNEKFAMLTVPLAKVPVALEG